MTALVLTPQPTTASVLVEVTGAPGGFVTITRTDANGTGVVRLRSGQVPTAGALTIVDSEPALTGTLTYDVVDSASVTTTASTTLDGTVSLPQLTGVQYPQLHAEPPMVTGYTASRATGSTVLRVVGRGDPVVILAPTHTREGQLRMWFADYADALAAADVLADAQILMLRQVTHPGMDMYFLPSSITTTPLQITAEGWRWETSADYVEVRNPNLPLLGAAGWTFDDVVASYATFAAVRSAFATFNDLAVGP